MRFIIVSNRVPFSFSESNGKVDLIKSGGGLVTGLSSYLQNFRKSFPKSDYQWVGSMGSDKLKLDETHQKKILQQKLQGIFLGDEELKSFYNGFCNDTIWPLFHYFPSFIEYKKEQWEVYKKINEKFCAHLLKILKPTDIVWIHDYHLMLLPGMLREKMPELNIGFFLHIPFPVFEIFRLLPNEWRKQILLGILGADMVGFHTYDYCNYFTACVQKLLGFEANMGLISADDRNIKVDAFPMGIDFEKFYKLSKSEKVHEQMAKIKTVTREQKIILSIDRLDYTKGIEKRLQAYGHFLQKNPDWREKVVFMLVVIPSRIQVPHYKQMKEMIDLMVGKINGSYGTIVWNPILYQYKSLEPTELSALYSLSDVAMVTPLRDGMNLIAKEYIASHPDYRGVLILSEMAGTAHELGEAILINPYDIENVESAIAEALNMSIPEQQERNQIMQERLKRYSVKRWADDFLKEMISFKKNQRRERTSQLIGNSLKTTILNKFQRSKTRLIFLDYDGTIVPFSRLPKIAKPDPEILSLIDKLSALPDTKLVLISGRDRATLEKWFDQKNIDIVAEHGIWMRNGNGGWKMIKPFNNDWKKAILPVLRLFADRLPGSLVEEKEFSVAWHYRAADSKLASMRAQDLTNTLINLTVNLGLNIVQGNKVVEVRNAGADKGSAALYFLAKNKHSFTLALGDDITDEDMFKVMPKNAFVIKVGRGQSVAKYFLKNYKDVRIILKEMTGMFSNH